VFPSSGVVTRRPASLPRVLGGTSSPASTVLSGRYDFLPPVSPRFVSFAWRYHSSARVSPAVRLSAAAGGVLELVTRYLPPGSCQWRRQDLLRSWGTQCALALLSDPGGTDASGHCNAPARPPLCPRRRLPHLVLRGSITRLRHWLSTLRRPGRPDTTQDSLPVVGQTLPDGLVHPQGSNKRFRAVSYISASFSKFNVAQGHMT